MNSPLTENERVFLLDLARKTISNALQKLPKPGINQELLTNNLQENGASFVTLTIDGNLRGCIGSLEAHQSLAVDVREHAYQAAFEDYRFKPLAEYELPEIKIEISRLTAPTRLDYQNPADLPGSLHPGEDGVILQDGFRRATFLPQVWEQLPRPEEFLSHLCAKMGVSADLWSRKKLDVSIYHVEEFHE